MLYYEQSDKKGRMIGGIAGAGYILFWVLLMLLFSFDFDRTDYSEGILINFGDVESAAGNMDPDENIVNSAANPQNSAPDTPDEILTTDDPEAPEVAQPDRVEQPRPQERPQQDNRNNTEQQTPPQPERTVNRQALFPGRTAGSNSPSEGTAQQGQGNQGVQEGSPQGSHDGTGVGAGGTGFDLAGRSVVGALPAPTYGNNKQGRVIVEITVNPAGQVTNAIYRARGSTTNDSELVNAAIRAARQSRFNSIQGDGLQTGTITYNFVLK